MRDIETRVHRAANGGLLIEVLGRSGKKKADELASKIGAVLKEEADVRRPVRKAELRLRGLDESVSSEEIAQVLARYGDCEVRDIQVGPLRVWAGRELNQVWIQLPLVSALRLADIGRV